MFHCFDPRDRELDIPATPDDARREYARNVGADHPEKPWILTDWDTWEKNPFYHGPPALHPEEHPED